MKQIGLTATAAGAIGATRASTSQEANENEYVEEEEVIENENGVGAQTEFAYPWQFISRRSAVMANNGMVATSHPLAAQVGVQTLRDGGNAVDAAIATAVMLNLVEPHMTSIAGDMFALTHFDGEYKALNGSGRSSAAADIDTYRQRTEESEDGEPIVPTEGGLPVTVPGALDGFYQLSDRYGTLEFEDLLQPAIEYARDGVPVSEYVAAQWEAAAPRVSEFESFAETFLINGEPPKPEQTFTNPDFADSLERIASEGIETVYGGEFGAEIVEAVQAHDGVLELSDLENHESTWGDPISTEYRGIEVLEHPPNTQGVVALQALNILENFDISTSTADPDRLHRLIEAVKIAFADAYEYVSDPEKVDIPIETMLSPKYGEQRATEIGPEVGNYEPRADRQSDTVYLTVVDGDGNAVSLINSGYWPFASGIVVGGFPLQNRGSSFSLCPGDANALEPRKRPFHTLVPAMLAEDGKFRASFGVMGGDMQPQGHVQVVANLIDSGLNPQAALDAPRFRFIEDHEVTLETTRLPSETIDELRARGHDVLTEEAYFEPDAGHYGGAQFIYRNEDGTLIGASEPRRDGQAIGF
ncbi:gamma-glutamyltransferase [Natronococcus wangiae]|uniref:gamma-glutamyltransferase n=1 Tax=Natronococcus wangiae TaxID=3068275 RepID=UPI00273DB43F|nr:gamma-glutamyltransferase [Natronococcus sp. AD5]